MESSLVSSHQQLPQSNEYYCDHCDAMVEGYTTNPTELGYEIRCQFCDDLLREN